jgi:hypothetical protein
MSSAVIFYVSGVAANVCRAGGSAMAPVAAAATLRIVSRRESDCM